MRHTHKLHFQFAYKRLLLGWQSRGVAADTPSPKSLRLFRLESPAIRLFAPN
jgi:hypothetical protein